MKALIWNTQMKKVLKCSNISVKKYQNTPMFGVRSGTDRLQMENNIDRFVFLSYQGLFWL